MSGNQKALVSKEQNERHKKILEALMKAPENKECADCKGRAPRWASVNLGIFVCIQCSGIHRSLGVHISKVRSATLDTWLPEQVEYMKAMGNVKANDYWEAELPSHFRRPAEDDRDGLINFIRNKYEEKRYIPSRPHGDRNLSRLEETEPEYPASRYSDRSQHNERSQYSDRSHYNERSQYSDRPQARADTYRRSEERQSTEPSGGSRVPGVGRGATQGPVNPSQTVRVTPVPVSRVSEVKLAGAGRAKPDFGAFRGLPPPPGSHAALASPVKVNGGRAEGVDGLQSEFDLLGINGRQAAAGDGGEKVPAVVQAVVDSGWADFTAAASAAPVTSSPAVSPVPAQQKADVKSDILSLFDSRPPVALPPFPLGGAALPGQQPQQQIYIQPVYPSQVAVPALVGSPAAGPPGMAAVNFVPFPANASLGQQFAFVPQPFPVLSPGGAQLAPSFALPLHSPGQSEPSVPASAPAAESTGANYDFSSLTSSAFSKPAN